MPAGWSWVTSARAEREGGGLFPPLAREAVGETCRHVGRGDAFPCVPLVYAFRVYGDRAPPLKYTESTNAVPRGEMRPLTEEETKLVFEKLSKYVGDSLRVLVDRPDGSYCFRLHRDRVYYVSEAIMKQATNFSRKNLISLGTCMGKFTKSGKFRLHITSLDLMAPYAKYKIWLKPSAEQQYLYGNHVQKSGLGRISENTPQYQGVVIYSMNDMPLGFGVTAKSTQDCRHADPTAVVVFHQADIGEYLRSEQSLT